MKVVAILTISYYKSKKEILVLPVFVWAENDKKLPSPLMGEGEGEQWHEYNS
jgi:hypothetical protein